MRWRKPPPDFCRGACLTLSLSKGEAGLSFDKLRMRPLSARPGDAFSRE